MFVSLLCPSCVFTLINCPCCCAVMEGFIFTVWFKKSALYITGILHNYYWAIALWWLYVIVRLYVCWHACLHVSNHFCTMCACVVKLGVIELLWLEGPCGASAHCWRSNTHTYTHKMHLQTHTHKSLWWLSDPLRSSRSLRLKWNSLCFLFTGYGRPEDRRVERPNTHRHSYTHVHILQKIYIFSLPVIFLYWSFFKNNNW